MRTRAIMKVSAAGLSLLVLCNLMISTCCIAQHHWTSWWKPGGMQGKRDSDLNDVYGLDLSEQFRGPSMPFNFQNRVPRPGRASLMDMILSHSSYMPAKMKDVDREIPSADI